jgi:hypothetical protein
VLLSGTNTNAQIYSNNSGAALSNPFTADPTSGAYSFYADNGNYDITLSGGSPSITTPYTRSVILLLDNTTVNQPVVFAGSILPSINVNDDIGSTLFQWRNIYASVLTLAGSASIGGPLLPATDGAALGSATFRWDAILRNLTFYSASSSPGSFIHSNTAPRQWLMPDATGTVPLLSLGQTWTALQTFSSGAALGNSTFSRLTTATANPALTGNIRLATTDSIVFRNPANSSDVNGLSVDPAAFSYIIIGNSGGAGGVEFGSASGPTINTTTGGTFNGTLDFPLTLNARSSSGPAGQPITLNAANAVSGNNNGGQIILNPGAKSGSGQPGSVVIFNGISNSGGTGFKHLRVTTGSIGSTSRAEVTLNWTGSFADTNYTVACSVNDSTSGATAQGLVLERTRQKTAALTTVVINNPTGGALTGTLECVAIHDGI